MASDATPQMSNSQNPMQWRSGPPRLSYTRKTGGDKWSARQYNPKSAGAFESAE
jgi:hypothetical protein